MLNMQKQLITILLGWLAVANVSGQDDHDIYIRIRHSPVEKTSEVDGMSASLAQISSSQLKPDLAKIRVFRYMMAHEPPKECSNEILSALLEVQKDDQPMEKLTSHPWRVVVELCAAHLERSYNSWNSQVSEVGPFFEAFGIHGSEITRATSHGVVTYPNLYNYLREATSSSSKTRFEVEQFDRATGKTSLKKDQGLFEIVFQDLLKKPCKSIISDDHLLENMSTLVLADSEAENSSRVSIITELKNMNWLRHLCFKIINMRPSERNLVFNSVQL